MARVAVALLALLVLAAAPSLIAAEGEDKFVLPDPEEHIRTDGGGLYIWSSKFEALKDTYMGAAKIVINPHSLAIPMYTDSNTLLYVVKGKAKAGLISPLGIASTSVRWLEAGDVLAIPHGWTRWIANTDQNEELILIGTALTGRRRGGGGGAEEGTYVPFHLMGAKKDEFGGLLHGFSKETLAQAWDVSEEDVEQLLQSQSEHAFVPLTQEQVSRLLKELDMAPESVKHHGGSTLPVGTDLVYNIRKASPDILVKDGGHAIFLSGLRLPVLMSMGMSVVRYHLQPKAMKAPAFINSASVLYVEKGSGRAEMVYGDGETALYTELKEGDLVVFPAFHPCVLVANDNDDLVTVSFLSKSLPLPVWLAGANSIFRALPKEVLRAGFNIDQELEEKLRSKRRSMHEIAIFPGTGGGKHRKGAFLGWDPVSIKEAEEAAIRNSEHFYSILHRAMGVEQA
jgi:mannose-6-phosphate isomerase-like protein (cupin superfamily)